MIIDPFMIQPRSSMQPSAALHTILYASSAAAPRRSSLPDLPFTHVAYFFLLIILLASCNHGNTVSGLNTSTASAARCPITRVSPNMAASKEEADLKVLVPNITSLRQFVNCSDPANVRGFCIDVFEMALAVLTRAPSLPPNFSIHYTCFNFSASPGSAGPTYNTMVELVANGSFDVVVGDVTIGAHRVSRVDFTQKYMESGVIILAKVATMKMSPWLFFLRPFSTDLWCIIVAVFAIMALSISFLENHRHPELSQGPRIQRLGNHLRFSLETLLLLERESLKSTIASGVMLAWVIFVVLLTGSYTAGLSSSLTVENLLPPTPNLLSLKDSGKKIGYRRGSIVKDFLTQRFQIPEERLVPLRMVSEFVNNITKGPENGGVVAIVDEIPYANLILSNLSTSSCDFAIAGPQITQQGFGFGFNKERKLEPTFSIALMNLSEMGCLQELQSIAGMDDTSKCSEVNASINRVTWKNILPLCLLFVCCLFLSLLIHFFKEYVHPQHAHPQ